MSNLELLKARLEKEKQKKQKAEEQIQKIEKQIEQTELSNLKATMAEYNVDFKDLKELIKGMKN